MSLSLSLPFGLKEENLGAFKSEVSDFGLKDANLGTVDLVSSSLLDIVLIGRQSFRHIPIIVICSLCEGGQGFVSLVVERKVDDKVNRNKIQISCKLTARVSVRERISLDFQPQRNEIQCDISFDTINYRP